MENILRQTMPKSIVLDAMVPGDLWPVLGNATQLLRPVLGPPGKGRGTYASGGRYRNRTIVGGTTDM